jgi:hypothetical protein
MRFGWPSGDTNWKRYRTDFIHNLDFQKFNGDCIQIVSGTKEQHRALRNWLVNEYEAGNLFFGSHEETQAIVSCYIQDYAKRHLHFVDGASGGLTIAATNLKNQIQEHTTQ